ncbi:hypothetical protein JS756_30095 [Streptomyces actuosus]|uniref:Lipoprotein n=1 Tax=Streptomyces actuosus TaxID=1885 RepID=A0ABS2VZ21_STRAS|nr:hypothetical protein [Streptomyces actuosus]MBN0048289.1 hypothetical protein [Streptomyces actuosus]
MAAFRRIRRRRVARAAAAAGFAVVALGGAAACDPGAVSAATVAYTTDRTATAELERQHTGVRWLNCSAGYGSHGATPSAGTATVATVDCEGRTDDGRDITVTGKVTRAVSGSCVRGDLVAKVGGKQVFHVGGLGTCDTTPSPVGPPPGGGQPGRPTVTVTVTRTVWCQQDPQCRPVEGK